MKYKICLISLLFLNLVFTRFSFAGEITSSSQNPPLNSGWFSSFDTTDWILIGGVALADIADFASSNYMSHISRKNAIACKNSGFFCQNTFTKGEGNPLITGLYGTRYPNTWQYASWFAGEFVTQSLIAWVLPEKLRDV